MRFSVILALVALLAPTPTLAQTATYYGHHFSGRPMANGKRYNPNHLVAAHPRYPIGTRLRVTNRKTGKSVIVTVSDRCACSLDLSRAAFKRISNIKKGRVPVSVSPL